MKANHKNKESYVPNKQYAIMVSFRNPYKADGGTDKFIIQMAEQYEKANIDVIILFPLDLRKVYNINWLYGWGIVENKIFGGIKPLKTIIDTVNNYNLKKTCVGVIIHNIIFMDLDELYSILSFRSSIVLYIHDYSSCCVQENLRKNNLRYCGDSRINIEKCSDCCYYEKAQIKHVAVEKFLSKFPQLRVIAPSGIAAMLWSESFPEYKDSIEIIPHLLPSDSHVSNGKELSEEDEIRIAFVGSATISKGWDVFVQAHKKTNSTASGDKLSWFYFGHSKIQEKNIHKVDVKLLENGKSPMTEALKQNDIDAVVLYSDWPETYSFTYYESIAANCFVITNEDSGNIASEVMRTGTGIVLPNTENALENWLNDRKSINKQINHFRKMHMELPSVYKNNIPQVIQPEKVLQKINDYRTGSFVASSIANIAYRFVYSSFMSNILPITNAPKTSIDRIIHLVNKKHK